MGTDAAADVSAHETGRAGPRNELLDDVARGGESLSFNRHLGVTVLDLEPGHAVVALPDDDRLHNHLGGPHAIAQLAPAELAGALAASTRLADVVEGWVPVIAGCNVRYHATARGALRAEAYVSVEDADRARARLGDGRLKIPVEIRITSPDAHVATMTGYYVFLDPSRLDA